MSEQAAPVAPGAPSSGKATKGMRALAILAALVLAFASAVMISVAVDVNDTPTLQEVHEGQPLKDGSYYKGSKSTRTIGVVLTAISGALAALAVLASLAFAITGRRGRPILILTVAAIVIGAIAFIVA